MDSSFSLHGLFRRSSAHLRKCIVSIRYIQMADKLPLCALPSPQQMDVDDSDATEAPTVSTNSEATTLQHLIVPLHDNKLNTLGAHSAQPPTPAATEATTPQVSTACGSSGEAAAASSSSSNGDTGDDEVKDLPAAAAKAERQIGAGGNSVVRKVVKGITDDDYERLKLLVLHASTSLRQDPAGRLTSQSIDVRIEQLQKQCSNHFYLNTAFFGLLCPPHLEQHIDYERVKGWTAPARLPKDAENLFMLEKVFFPINAGDGHWVLVVADFTVQPHTVSCFDSLKQQQHGGKYVEAITAYLTEEAASKGVQDQSIKFEGYAETPQSATRQSNSNDCGVLMLHYMQELSMAAGSVRHLVQCRVYYTRPSSMLSILRLPQLTQEQINESRLSLLECNNNEPDDKETADMINVASTSKAVPPALTAVEESCVSVTTKPTSPDESSIQQNKYLWHDKLSEAIDASAGSRILACNFFTPNLQLWWQYIFADFTKYYDTQADKPIVCLMSCSEKTEPMHVLQSLLTAVGVSEAHGMCSIEQCLAELE
eukprot:8139-Heterococcus_DN1.PRE.9